MERMYKLTPETTAQANRIIESWASLQWKVLGHHFTRDDMIQEGYLVLDRVVKAYPKRSENHLLSTLAAALKNRSSDLSHKPDRDACLSDLSQDASSLPFADPTIEDSHDSDYPEWLALLLDFIQNATPRQLAAIQSDEGDDYLAKKCGLPRGMPVKDMVQKALGAA